MYFPELTAGQLEQFRNMYPIYEEWNGKINVISRKDTENFYERHVLHSLAIARFIQFKPGTRIIDVGTGGGFPGIPLAVMFPETKFYLIDSIGKKIKVVEDVARQLGLSNVSCDQIRAEEVQSHFDFVVSRAVAEIDTFMRWTQHLVAKTSKNEIENGLICLKGGDLVEEFENVRQHFKFIPLSNYYPNREFFETKKLAYIKM
jgi:16S rRNA (guanine527-N7)-methyltransferase